MSPARRTLVGASPFAAFLLVALNLVVIGSACAQSAPTTVAPAASEALSRKLTGTIESIDASSRWLVIRAPAGRTLAGVAAPQVKDIEKLKVGDNVALQLTPATATELRVLPADPAGPVANPIAPPSKPESVASVREQSGQANVWAVDRKSGMVALRGARGVVFDVRVPEVTLLAELKTGDRVLLTWRDAVLTSLVRQPAR
jgi:Cu/Ag efflux protein CusF